MRSAIALASAGVLVLGLSSCDDSPSEGDVDPAALSIVEQVQVDVNGNEVAAVAEAPPADPAGDGKAVCDEVNIAVAGEITGPDAALGINIKNGVQLAVDKHNAANPGCQVQLRVLDTEGDLQKATVIALQVVGDDSTIGLVGPAFSGETKASGAVFNQAGIVAATASATNVSLSEQGWRTFFRGLANDNVQGPAVANYMKASLGLGKVCVLDDGTDYGTGLAQVVRRTLGDSADSGCNVSIRKGSTDFSKAVDQVKGIAPQGVFFAGYYAEGAQLVRQLRDAGVTAAFVTGDGGKEPEFVKQAGGSSKDAVISCPCGPAPAAFANEYGQKFGQPPGAYSAEGYDLGTILLKGIDSGATTRAALLDFVRNYSGQGVARKYQWSDTGELATSSIWMYKVAPDGG